MSTFVLTNKSTSELETTVFSSEGGDAVAIFTDHQNAQQYLDDAGWNDMMTVAELDSVQLMEWLIHCHRNGVRLMVTDPNRMEHQAGMRLSTLEIEAQLENAGNHITLVANPDF